MSAEAVIRAERHGQQVRLAGRVMWPTPNARYHKDCGPNVDWEKVKARSKLAGAAGGSMNPEFVEWLMNFPKGWTNPDK